MSKTLFIILFISICLIGFFFRFYKLGQIPNGFYQDESAIGYNAYALMQTGKDEYGKSFPLYFKSFGDWKLPVYIYATIPSIALFGMNEFAVRFPSALFGFLTVIAMFFLVKELTGNKALALATMAGIAINPWSLEYNRATFEVSIALFFFVSGTYLLIKSPQKRGLFFLGTLCFIFGLYSYNLTRLLSPLLYILTLGFMWQQKQKFFKNESIISAIFSLILLIPFFFSFFSTSGVGSAKGTLFFTSAAVQAQLIELRSYLVDLPHVFTALFFNKVTVNIWQYLTNIAAYFSVDFFFLHGDPHGNHGIGNAGQFYLFELPLIIGGLIITFRSRKPWSYFLVGWGILTILVAAATRDIPQATRSFFLIVPLQVFSAVGLVEVMRRLYCLKDSKLKVGLTILVLLFVGYNLIYYFTSYYVRFPILYAKDWRLEDKEVSLYISQHQKDYSKIIFDTKAGFIYTSLLFFTKYPPLEFQQTVKRQPDDSEGFSMVDSFGKYEFKDVDLSKDYQKGTLIITTADRLPSSFPTINTFLYPKRPVVTSIGQNIYTYPVQEVAYVAITRH